MLKINGRLQCVFEYLHDCVAHKRVVDIVRRGKTVYYVFEDGHQLPLLCSCCGAPLVIDNLKKERKNAGGRKLDRLLIDTAQLEDGSYIEELILLFSKKGLLSKPLGIPVAFEVATKLRHPADCPRKGDAPAKKSPSKKRNRSHKRRRRK